MKSLKKAIFNIVTSKKILALRITYENDSTKLRVFAGN